MTFQGCNTKKIIYQAGVAANLWLASKSQSISISYLHLEVSDEPLHGDFLFDLQEEAVAAQHHALQDVQGHLLHRYVGRLGVDKAGNLEGMEGQKEEE